ncbi:MAG: hypothetical protein IKW92_00765 [Firmicutes bacterium]|nr:hypothetical protein [Bacillota bacterium]
MIKNDYKKIPRYYKAMYLDGFTPEEILFATRREMLERLKEEKAPTPPDDYNLNFKSTVEVKK